MTQFRVNTTSLESQISALQGVGQTLSGLQNSVQAARNNLQLNTASSDVLKQHICIVENEILDRAANMDSLAQALEYIINCYVTTENQLTSLNRGNEAESTSADSTSFIDDLVNKFREWLRNILIDLGIIGNEPQEPEGVTRQQEQQQDDYMKSQIAALMQNDRYSRETWENASVEERKAILNEYMQEVAAIMGLSIGAINYTYRAPTGNTYNMGSYNSGTNLVSINEWVLGSTSVDSYRLMSTIVHELRHAYQHAAIENPDQFIVSQETIDSWQESFDNYRSTSGFMNQGMSESEAYDAYRNQAVERDARAFAGQN